MNGEDPPESAFNHAKSIDNEDDVFDEGILDGPEGVPSITGNSVLLLMNFVPSRARFKNIPKLVAQVWV